MEWIFRVILGVVLRCFWKSCFESWFDVLMCWIELWCKSKTRNLLHLNFKFLFLFVSFLSLFISFFFLLCHFSFFFLFSFFLFFIFLFLCGLISSCFGVVFRLNISGNFKELFWCCFGVNNWNLNEVMLSKKLKFWKCE